MCKFLLIYNVIYKKNKNIQRILHFINRLSLYISLEYYIHSNIIFNIRTRCGKVRNCRRALRNNLINFPRKTHVAFPYIQQSFVQISRRVSKFQVKYPRHSARVYTENSVDTAQG